MHEEDAEEETEEEEEPDPFHIQRDIICHLFRALIASILYYIYYSAPVLCFPSRLRQCQNLNNTKLNHR